MGEQQYKWLADPKRGEEFVEPRRREVLEALKTAADVAFYDIEQQLEADIENLRKKAGDRRSNIMRTIDDVTKSPPMKVVRKYWDAEKETMWRTFLHNMEKQDG